MKASVHAGAEEIDLLRIRVEAIKSPAVGEVLVKAPERREQESVERVYPELCVNAKPV